MHDRAASQSDDETAILEQIVAAMEPLDAAARVRVVSYLRDRYADSSTPPGQRSEVDEFAVLARISTRWQWILVTANILDRRSGARWFSAQEFQDALREAGYIIGDVSRAFQSACDRGLLESRTVVDGARAYRITASGREWCEKRVAGRYLEAGR